MKKLFIVIASLIVFTTVSCVQNTSYTAQLATYEQNKVKSEAQEINLQTETNPKWILWSSNKTMLRGANTDQRVNEDNSVCVPVKPKNVKSTPTPEPSPAAIFPAYDLNDFKKLASWNANYVNLSIPGIFSETPDANGNYPINIATRDNLDRLIDYAEQADLFVVISFRTGPERTKEVFNNEGMLSVLFKDDDPDQAIKTRAVKAQAAWAEMWKEVAQRYKNRIHIAAYDLMVEPEISPTQANKWDLFANRMIKAIRDDFTDTDGQTISGDKNTPIIIGGSGMSSIEGLEKLNTDSISSKNEYKYLVYAVHQYEPTEYTQQTESDDREYVCGKSGFEKGEPKKEDFRAYTVKDENGNESVLTKLKGVYARISSWKNASGKERFVVVNEFGVVRWAGAKGKPDADKFLTAQFEQLEELKVNHAIWKWDPQCCIGDDDLNFRHGQKPKNHDETDSLLSKAIIDNWKKNGIPALRPSTFAKH